ncbi:MAG: hypothetical protein RR183_04840, partial [Bacteroidales bacterium]
LFVFIRLFFCAGKVNYSNMRKGINTLCAVVRNNLGAGLTDIAINISLPHSPERRRHRSLDGYDVRFFFIKNSWKLCYKILNLKHILN